MWRPSVSQFHLEVAIPMIVHTDSTKPGRRHQLSIVDVLIYVSTLGVCIELRNRAFLVGSDEWDRWQYLPGQLRETALFEIALVASAYVTLALMRIDRSVILPGVVWTCIGFRAGVTAATMLGQPIVVVLGLGWIAAMVSLLLRTRSALSRLIPATYITIGLAILFSAVLKAFLRWQLLWPWSV